MIRAVMNIVISANGGEKTEPVGAGHACKIAKWKVKFQGKGGRCPMVGRKPKLTAVKKLEGNPGKKKLNTKEPVPAKGMPDCPTG